MLGGSGEKCVVPGCRMLQENDGVFCVRCWSHVPPELRARIALEWRPFSDTKEFRDAVQAAITTVGRRI